MHPKRPISRWRLLPYAVALPFLFGCMGLCKPSEPPTVHEETYLPYKQPNRDRSYPVMVTLRDDGDHYWELPRHETTDDTGQPFQWGKRYRVEITSRYNSYTQHSSRSVTAVLDATPELEGTFRLYSISKPYFGEDARSFIDGKAMECVSDEVCAALDEAVASDERFDMVMRFGESVDAPLVVESVEEPTCYGAMDCRARESCCDRGDANRCVVFEECTDENRAGVVPGE